MHRLTPALSILLVLPGLATAAPKADQLRWGGLGYMTQGWVIGDVGGTGTSVAAAPDVGVQLGGGATLLLAGRVAVGGQGYGYYGLGGGDAALDADVHGGGAGAHIGYALVNERNHLLYPYVGAAFHGHDLVLANGHYPSSIAGVVLEPGQRETLSSGGTALDIGVSLFRLFWGEEAGGMAVGGSFGGWIPLAADAWSTDSGQPTTLDGTTGGFYFRLNLGGGGATRG